MLLEDKAAIVYGGGGLIGGAVARAFAPIWNGSRSPRTATMSTPSRAEVARSSSTWPVGPVAWTWPRSRTASSW
jgi:hypothetical protein